jgi:hypothetical protein
MAQDAPSRRGYTLAVSRSDSPAAFPSPARGILRTGAPEAPAALSGGFLPADHSVGSGAEPATLPRSAAACTVRFRPGRHTVPANAHERGRGEK